jgi:hypothetical protein
MNYIVRRIITVFAIILIIIFGVVLLRGGSNKPKPITPVTRQILDLPEYANTDAQVRMTIDGRINGEDIHRAIRITVGRDQRSIDIIHGYSDQVIESHQYPNSLNAYDVFLRALKGQGFLQARKKVKNTDDRGQCPLGQRYIFELNQSGEQISRLWASNCSGVGTFAGKSSNTQTLFKRQISEYDKITSKVQL